ncbi:hypothetical protein J2W37_004667 [Variovorax paradoxus]|uniref:hypothetical protein n=1 Tax=Variovorax paradoxus TaxID=34073 RepID=UPI001AE2671B|nr:hypothetical protein [Variovorax paradoxus]MDP9966937.1 hypothetical protein [Variovorax paradoxus]
MVARRKMLRGGLTEMHPSDAASSEHTAQTISRLFLRKERQGQLILALFISIFDMAGETQPATLSIKVLT